MSEYYYKPCRACAYRTGIIRDREFINGRVNKHVDELKLGLFLAETAFEPLRAELLLQSLSPASEKLIVQLQRGLDWLRREHLRWEDEVEDGLI